MGRRLAAISPDGFIDAVQTFNKILRYFTRHDIQPEDIIPIFVHTSYYYHQHYTPGRALLLPLIWKF
uniref:SFRICE_039541 n=1 Tax=Spodoptera frugiperda TaxID=7108 RepID=A0A2H1W0A7_SPOFR